MPANRQLALNTEYPDPNEEEITSRLVAFLRDMSQQRFLQGLTYRALNTKSVAAVQAEFIIEPDLPEELRVGVFRQPRRYPAWIRFSNTLPDPKPDQVPDVRGMGFKLSGVDGTKLLSDDQDPTAHDFAFITADTFFTSTVAEFDEFCRTGILNSRRTLADYWRFLMFALGHRAAVACIRRAHRRFGSLLEVDWYSATPYLFGSRAVKYSLRPRLPAVTEVPDRAPINYLREGLARQLREGTAGFDFRIQFQLDPYKQPIEDALIPWNERDSPWHKIATLSIPSQDVDSPERLLFCEYLSMNPWRCLPEHRPLGGINRARKRIYHEGWRYRQTRNAAAIRQSESRSATANS